MKDSTSTGHTGRDHLEVVRGEVAFVRRTADEDARATTVPRYTDLPMVSYDLTIRNARPIVGELSLDREGFTLVPHRIACVDEKDPEVLVDKYLEEMVPFIQKRFNASWVVPRRASVIIRRADERSVSAPPPTGTTDERRVRAPAGVAHIDYAPVAAPVIAAAVNQLQGLPVRPYSRLLIIQAWHPLSPSPQDFPLALCDATTVSESDMFLHNYTSSGISHKACTMRYNPAQQWYYFQDMSPDEFLMWKGYDSDDHYRMVAPHAAFDNRRAFPNAVPRESIESRFMLYYE